MSVIVRNMEMPISCAECPIGGSIRCALIPGVPAWCAEYDQCVEEKKLHSQCPLIPVPPHGDLIERDPLRASIRESIDECHKWADEMREAENDEMVIRAEQSLGTFVECGLRVKNAPTVIPAEEGE